MPDLTSKQREEEKALRNQLKEKRELEEQGWNIKRGKLVRDFFKRKINTEDILKIHQDIREATWFDNRLDLNWRKMSKNENNRCEKCHHEIEDLEHFLLHYNHYSDMRQQYSFMEQSYTEDKEVHIAETLLLK